jgi:hypothetical protein
MTFTDNDLTGLKEELISNKKEWASLAKLAWKIEALVTRLEAAEKFIKAFELVNKDKPWVPRSAYFDSKLEAWRKAAGK